MHALFQLIFAIPSNIFMRYIGPTSYLSLSVLIWGTLTIGMAFVKDVQDLIIVQILLVSELNKCLSFRNSIFIFEGRYSSRLFPRHGYLFLLMVSQKRSNHENSASGRSCHCCRRFRKSFSRLLLI